MEIIADQVGAQLLSPFRPSRLNCSFGRFQSGAVPGTSRAPVGSTAADGRYGKLFIAAIMRSAQL